MIAKLWTSSGLAFPLLGGLLLCSCAAWAEPAPTGVVARAAHLFGAVEQRFEAIQTLQYTVERTTQSTRQQMQERWLFSYRKPGDIRIDYQSPQDRLILVTPANMVEYLPAVRKALRTDLARLPAAERSARAGGVLARVAVEGLRVGDVRALLARVQRVTPDARQAGAQWVEGAGPRFRILVDPARQAVLATELWDAHGDIKLRTTAEDFVEAAPGQWLPQRLSAVFGTADGTVTSTVRLSGIRVNAALDPALFQFVPDRKVILVER
jgi:outer membrane lipoprotein-sorting protein